MADSNASGSAPGWDARMWGQTPLIRRDRIKRGQYLDCYCPHCEAVVNEGDRAVFEVESAEGEVGPIRVAAYLNVYDHETDLSLEEGKELRDVRCPTCHQSLILPDGECPECHGALASFKVAAARCKVDLRTCVRRGCQWFELDADDEQLLLLEGSDEW